MKKNTIFPIALRDYFAAMSLQGMCGDSAHTIRRMQFRLDGESVADGYKKMAEDAYRYADAMLAERSK